MLSTIIAIAAEIGAPVVKGILEKVAGKTLGETGTELAGKVIDAIAERAGTTADKLGEADSEVLSEAVLKTEEDLPEIIAAWNDSQRLSNELQLAEMEKGPTWTWAWRPWWMYTLMAIWVWYGFVVPVVNWIVRLAGGAEQIILVVDIATLIGLTTLICGLYMGGHTVKYVAANWPGKRP